MIKIIIFTHGDFGSEILKTAENIVGEQKEVFVFSLELVDSLISVSKKLGELLKKLESDEGTLILADMAGGTPCNATLPFSKNFKIEIITGLNLYMLISALMNRSSMNLKELAEKALEDAKKNITNVKESFLNKIK